VSEGEYAALNLGLKGGDEPARVERNRAIVASHLPETPSWMAQVHGTAVADLDLASGAPRIADAAVTASPGRVAAVLTADCMPLFLCDASGTRVGVAHAGWRGMSAGVIESAVRALGAAPGDVMAWMCPTIGPAAFEVGPEVREAFLAADGEAGGAFVGHTPGKYLADLYALARRRLAAAGVSEIHGGGWCTYTQADRFFSYRRAQRSGRMGAFIWRE
jgi:hypothetical protein